MKKAPKIKKKTASPLAKAVKNFKKRNQPFIRIERCDDAENNNPKETTEVHSGGRGIVYLGHLPKGFYEDEMRRYFTQFGHVTRIKLARSKKTGNSKGYAFIEFRFAEVAKIVAETMNNYLLFDRLLKANYVEKIFPPSFWYKAPTPDTYPGVYSRRRNARIKNSKIEPAKEMIRSERNKKRLIVKLRKLKEKGINYDVEADDLVSVNKDVDLTGVPVLEVDESDVEIEFKVPSYFIKKTISKKYSPTGKRLLKNKRHLTPSPVEVKCETPERKPEIKKAQSLKRKTPLRAVAAKKVKSEPRHITQRNGKLPLSRMSSTVKVKYESPEQTQEIPAQPSFKRKTPLRAETAIKVNSEPRHITQRNGKSPLSRMSSPVKVKYESPEQTQEIPAQPSFKRKTPLRAETAIKVNSEPRHITQRNGKSPLSRMSSPVEVKCESPEQTQEIPAQPSLKRKTPLRAETAIKVNSEPRHITQRNGKSPLVGKSNSRFSLGYTPKQRQDTLAQKSVKRKTPLKAEAALIVKREQKHTNQRIYNSPLKKKAESSKETLDNSKNLVQKGNRQPKPNTPKNNSNDSNKSRGKVSNKKLQKNNHK